MERALFEEIYTGSVEVIAKKLCEEHKAEGFRYVKNFEGVYEAYLNQWHYLRWLLKGKTGKIEDLTQEASKTLLDGHKTAACITTALAKMRLVVNDRLDDEMYSYSIHSKKDSKRLNEQVAVLCGISYLIGDMLNKPGNLKVNDELPFEMIWPKTDHDVASEGTEREDAGEAKGSNHYLDSLVRGVYYSGVSAHTDPILLANIYFLIEQYHRKSVELEREKLGLT